MERPSVVLSPNDGNVDNDESSHKLIAVYTSHMRSGSLSLQGVLPDGHIGFSTIRAMPLELPRRSHTIEVQIAVHSHLQRSVDRSTRIPQKRM